MKAIAGLILIALAAASPGLAQDRVDTPPKPPAVLNKDQLFHKYVTSTLGAPGALSAMLAASLDQWQDDPAEWGRGTSGYTKRWASSFSEAAIGSTTKYAVARLLHHDPSFTRCQCTGVGPRLRHALISPFTARTRTGRRVLSPAIVAGLAAESIVPAATWYPTPRGTVSGLQHTAVSVVSKMGVAVFREFVHIRRPKRLSAFQTVPPATLAPPAPERAQAPVQEAVQEPAQDPPADPGVPASASPAVAAVSFASTFWHNLVDDVKHLPRRNSVFWVAGGAGLAAAVHPADKVVNRHLLGSPAWDRFLVPGHVIGGTQVQVAAGLLTYGIGRSRGSDRARHLGMDLMEAQLLTEGIVQGLKLIGRRTRPLNPDGTANANTSFAFPSGHAAVTFAGAKVLEQHLGWKFAVPAYLVATYVALSRLHDNEHYLSDVVFGAAAGILVGRSVTWHGRSHYPIRPIVQPDFLGLGIEWK